MTTRQLTISRPAMTGESRMCDYMTRPTRQGPRPGEVLATAAERLKFAKRVSTRYLILSLENVEITRRGALRPGD